MQLKRDPDQQRAVNTHALAIYARSHLPCVFRNHEEHKRKVLRRALVAARRLYHGPPGVPQKMGICRQVVVLEEAALAQPIRAALVHTRDAQNEPCNTFEQSHCQGSTPTHRRQWARSRTNDKSAQPFKPSTCKSKSAPANAETGVKSMPSPRVLRMMANSTERLPWPRLSACCSIRRCHRAAAEAEHAQPRRAKYDARCRHTDRTCIAAANGSAAHGTLARYAEGIALSQARAAELRRWLLRP